MACTPELTTPVHAAQVFLGGMFLTMHTTARVEPPNVSSLPSAWRPPRSTRTQRLADAIDYDDLEAIALLVALWGAEAHTKF